MPLIMTGSQLQLASMWKIATIDWHTMFCQSIILTILAFSLKSFSPPCPILLILLQCRNCGAFIVSSTVYFCSRDSQWIKVHNGPMPSTSGTHCACPPALQVAAELSQQQWKHFLNTDTTYCNRFKWALWNSCINEFLLLERHCSMS